MPEQYRPAHVELKETYNGHICVLALDGPYAGWVCYRHPDGQFVTLRDECSLLLAGDTKTHTAASLALKEALRADAKFKPYNSVHEGYGVLMEEVDEAWQEIKKNQKQLACAEMIQVAAVAIRFVAAFKAGLERPE